ncbi:Cyn operon transcriptional activator [Variovorax sp. PBL-H6]|uniref:LysR substrate-binding domain-containing protein n=1 Tax=Variovorax sp. PBL-H6 TaxID=434009 RepID=UPI001318D64D|nr:LysR substrate-binding domain-containing protein [Variovorax sp. PBL-H6]VTU16233.1 Cyn operon transcriptional activator [Variovorax sp. PBL-H6]
MELRHLRYFVSVVKLGSFTRAADELCITQPTLSHQIRQLEDELGCEVFERGARSVRLTGAGEIFTAYAGRALREAEDGKAAVRAFQGLREGRLAFGVVSSFTNTLLPPVLSRFQAEYPGIELNVLELPTAELERQVRDGELSFGVAYGPAHSELVALEEMFEEELALIVVREHPLAGRKSIGLGELGEVPLALLPRSFVSRKLVDAAFAEASCRPMVKLELNSIDALLQMAAKTRLGTILATRMASRTGPLVAVPIRPVLRRIACIFTRRGTGLPPAAKVILEMVRTANRSGAGAQRPESLKQ